MAIRTPRSPRRESLSRTCSFPTGSRRTLRCSRETASTRPTRSSSGTTLLDWSPSRRDDMVGLGRIFFRHRNAIAPILILVALAVGGPRVLAQVPQFDATLDVMGFLSVLAGQALRVVTIGYEYIERGGRDRKVYASELVQGGMFAHSRNPLYVGNLFMIVGYAMIVNSIAFYAIVVPISLLAYVAIVAAEEAFLAEKFGVRY